MELKRAQQDWPLRLPGTFHVDDLKRAGLDPDGSMSGCLPLRRSLGMDTRPGRLQPAQ
jgi:hypothetical protein